MLKLKNRKIYFSLKFKKKKALDQDNTLPSQYFYLRIYRETIKYEIRKGKLNEASKIYPVIKIKFHRQQFE
jgi:hypothetical protein